MIFSSESTKHGNFETHKLWSNGGTFNGKREASENENVIKIKSKIRKFSLKKKTLLTFCGRSTMLFRMDGVYKIISTPSHYNWGDLLEHPKMLLSDKCYALPRIPGVA